MKNYNISISLIMSLIKMVTQRQIEGKACEVGFTKRNSGLEAITFFKAFTFELWNIHEITLDIIAGKCEDLQYGLSLSKQALFERLEIGAKFMKELLGLAVNLATKQAYSAEIIGVLNNLQMFILQIVQQFHYQISLKIFIQVLEEQMLMPQ